MGGCGASPAVATLWGAKRLVLLAKVSGLRSETTKGGKGESLESR